MSSHLPRQIDPHRLAEKGKNLQGEIAVTDLVRLSKAVVLRSTLVPVTLEFVRELDGSHTISGSASAEVELTCQRCMESKSVKLKTEFRLAVVNSDEEAMHLREELDPVICSSGERLDLNTLVEDELLLALPIVVFHENEKDCVSSGYLASVSDQPYEEDSSSNPFAVLKKLKKDN